MVSSVTIYYVKVWVVTQLVLDLSRQVCLAWRTRGDDFLVLLLLQSLLSADLSKTWCSQSPLNHKLTRNKSTLILR